MNVESDHYSIDEMKLIAEYDDIVKKSVGRLRHARRKLAIRRKIEQSIENRLMEKELDLYYDCREDDASLDS